MPNRGLVVGISKYLPPTPTLTAPDSEAHNWKDLLPLCGIPGANVILRSNAAATLSEVHDRLFDLFHDAQPKEKCVFVYSGHGTVVKTGPGIGDEALQLFHPQGHPEAATLTDTELSAIIKSAQPSPEALLTLVLDSCFSGGFDVFPLEQRPPGGPEPKEAPEGAILFAPLLSEVEFNKLLTVHRFGSLWDKGPELAKVDPLVIAACGRHQKATEMPQSNPPHLEFSGRAIPKLRSNPNLSHIQLINAVNAEMSPQHAELHGNTPRRPHYPFFL